MLSRSLGAIVWLNGELAVMPEFTSGRLPLLLVYSTKLFHNIPAVNVIPAISMKIIPKKIEFFSETGFLMLILNLTQNFGS
jgi:hypothetical protein